MSKKSKSSKSKLTKPSSRPKIQRKTGLGQTSKLSGLARGPLVGVIMGSDSDWPVMSAAHEVLNDFGIAHEVRVVSAHRTPEAMLNYAQEAAGRGLRVIIAGAGGAAHLPGMVASATPLPVIGVPVNITSLDGLDALLSIAQMPKGVPVACVGVDQAANAALLAARLLAAGDLSFSDRLMANLLEYRAHAQQKVALSQRRLQGRLKQGQQRR